MQRKLLAIDVGTSALKAVVFGATGEIEAVASQPVSTHAGADRSQEQDPDEWWRALQGALADLPREGIAAVTLTGSMQSLIPLAPDATPVAPAVLYSDRRLSEDEVAELGKRLPPDYAGRTGNRLDPAHTILKLMQLDRFARDARRPGTRFTFGAKDAVSFRLTGRAAIDPTTASTTGLMDIALRAWDQELVAASGVAPEALPEIMPADAVVGEILPDAARALGLEAGTTAFNGAGDAAAATWGAFADRPGSACVYLGTTGWVAATLPMSEANPPRDIYTLADPVHRDRAIIVSPFLAAGVAMDWLAGLTGQEVDALIVAARGEDETPPGTMFLPYLFGERAPFEDRNVRGALLGLDHGDRQGAAAYAVMEGICFAVRHNLDSAGLPDATLTAVGGAARDELQRQLLADVLGREILSPPNSREIPAFGVLRMVADGAGFSVDVDTAGAKSLMPRSRRAERLDARYRTYLAASRFAREHAGALGRTGRTGPTG